MQYNSKINPRITGLVKSCIGLVITWPILASIGLVVGRCILPLEGSEIDMPLEGHEGSEIDTVAMETRGMHELVCLSYFILFQHFHLPLQGG